MKALLRGLAVTIVVLAIWDPVITSNRRTKPLLSVVTVDATADADLSESVARQLSRDFTIVREPLSGHATVLIGDRMPASMSSLGAPSFAVLPSRDRRELRIESVAAPSGAMVQSRVPVVPLISIRNAKGSRLELALRWQGVVVDRVQLDITSDSARMRIPLSFVPVRAAGTKVSVDARLTGRDAVASSDHVIDIRERKWTVLFFDRRPSWMSTFVRRALENDPRFAVSGRVVTSRNISSSLGAAPDALSDPSLLSAYDLIVTGSAESLTERDVAGLESFMRRRGGGALMLLDQTPGGPYSRLTDVRSWVNNVSSIMVPVELTGADSAAMVTSEIAWPATMPPGAEPVALSAPIDSIVRPVVWRAPVGAGQLLVSGALDSWRFRENGVASFEKFWRNVIASAADATAPPIEVHILKPILRPGEHSRVFVRVRDAALANLSQTSPVSASLSATVEDAAIAVPVMFFPTTVPGNFEGEVRAPGTAGDYRMKLTANGVTEYAMMVVRDSVSAPSPDERDLVVEWARSRGGRAFEEENVDDLARDIIEALSPQDRVERWHPMRSPWWILPLALALGTEWWLRRRSGLS